MLHVYHAGDSDSEIASSGRGETWRALQGRTGLLTQRCKRPCMQGPRRPLHQWLQWLQWRQVAAVPPMLGLQSGCAQGPCHALHSTGECIKHGVHTVRPLRLTGPCWHPPIPAGLLSVAPLLCRVAPRHTKPLASLSVISLPAFASRRQGEGGAAAEVRVSPADPDYLLAQHARRRPQGASLPDHTAAGIG